MTADPDPDRPPMGITVWVWVNGQGKTNLKNEHRIRNKHKNYKTMKKLVLTIAIVLGLSLSSFAEYGGGLFKRGVVSDEEFYGADYRGDGLLTPKLPGHDLNGDQDAPLGAGIALLAALGGAYLVAKKRREE